MSPYRGERRPRFSKAPKAPLWRRVWAWCRGVLGAWQQRAEDHAALNDTQGPARRMAMRREALREYPLDRAQALEALAYNAKGPRGDERALWLPMTMPGTRIRE